MRHLYHSIVSTDTGYLFSIMSETFPFLIFITRSAIGAIAELCVMSMTVIPLLLQDTCRKKGVTVVVITHNQAITAMADRIITVKNGTVTDMRKNEHIVPVEQIEW